MGGGCEQLAFLLLNIAIYTRHLLCEEKTPEYLVRWLFGGGTNSATFSQSSSGDKRMAVVPSDQGILSS
jgi:hypothetical protein